MKIELKSRYDQHLARRVWHLFGVLAILSIYRSLPEHAAIYAAGAVTLLAVGIDILRLRMASLNDVVLKVFSPIMRKSEINSPAGTSYLLAGVLTLILVFPPEIASLSLIFLAFADPAASYFGIRFGKKKILGQKSLEGSLAAFAFCTLASFVFYKGESLFSENIVVLALISGVIGALAELIPIGKIDDNFTLPILSAIGLSLIFWITGGFQ